MPLRDDLLNPIAGDNPAGADLRYDPLYDTIKEARRQDDDAPQGEWQHARKVADWPQVVKLTSEAIATKSKDLQLAAWLTEALLHREGLAGLRDGLDMTRGLLDAFWDHIYPEADDGDLEFRAAPLEWVGTRLATPVKLIAIDAAGNDVFAHTEALAIGSEADAEDSEVKQARRQAAIADGKPLIEDIDKAFADTPKSFYKKLVADLDGAVASLAALEALANERFGEFAPAFFQLREALTQEGHTVRQLLAKKLEVDPDPVEEASAEAAEDDAAYAAEDGASGGAGSTGGTAGAGRALAPEPVDAADAAGRITVAARFLRRNDPTNPASYLLLRALRWGELRADAGRGGGAPDARLLEAPDTRTRTQLRGLMLDSNWEELIESAESVMATPVGRGWLDLQRYTLTACRALGEDFAVVTSALRSELRVLLAAIPSLPTMTLMDDMPTATAATQQWLRDERLIPGEGDSEQDGADGDATEAAPMPSAPTLERESRAGLERAAAEVRAGRPEKAIELLMRALERERTRRGRFLRQAELARVMVDAGFVQLARPILQELMADVENHRLEEWEAGNIVARPLALLYRCLQQMDDDESTRQELYMRIARLDPLQALSFRES